MRRAARLGTLALAALLLPACATKRDLKDLRAEVIALQARQDSLLSVIQRQNREILDSVGASRAALVQVRGDLGRQLLGMEQQLVQIQELEGQSFSRLQQLRQQIDERSESLVRPPAGSQPPPAETGGTAQELYELGAEQLQRGAASTARRAFEQLIREHPEHERAPDAQFGIGESYVLEQQYERALAELERVAERYPAAARAPQALYRAGVIAEQQGNIPEARRYFEQILRVYPDSDAAGQARTQLGRLRE